MKDTDEYVKRIQAIALESGVSLTDAQACDALLRIAEAVKVIYQHNIELP